jgi:hypothetical protein
MPKEIRRITEHGNKKQLTFEIDKQKLINEWDLNLKTFNSF